PVRRKTEFRNRYVPGSTRTVPPPRRATESTAAWSTRPLLPTRSAFFGPTVMVSRSSHFGSMALSPEVARGSVTRGRASGAWPAAQVVAVNEPAVVPRKLRRCIAFSLEQAPISYVSSGAYQDRRPIQGPALSAIQPATHTACGPGWRVVGFFNDTNR